MVLSQILFEGNFIDFSQVHLGLTVMTVRFFTK